MTESETTPIDGKEVEREVREVVWRREGLPVELERYNAAAAAVISGFWTRKVHVAIPELELEHDTMTACAAVGG